MFDNELKALREAIEKEIDRLVKVNETLGTLNGATKVFKVEEVERPRRVVTKYVGMGEPGVRVSKKDWVTAQEAAQILSVHPTTVHGWIRKGFVYGEKGESKVRMFGGRTRTMKMWFVDANEVQDYAAKVEESSKTLHRRGAKAYRYKRGGVNGMDMSRMAEEVLKDVPPGVEMTANEVRKSIKEKFGVKVLKQSLWAVMSVLHKHKVIYRSRKGHYMIADRTPQQQPLQP